MQNRSQAEDRRDSELEKLPFHWPLGQLSGWETEPGPQAMPSRLDMRVAVVSPYPAPQPMDLIMGFIAEAGGAS